MGLLSWFGFGGQVKRLNLDLAMRSLVGEAQAFGLPDRDIANVNDMLEYAEHECAFDTLIVQLNEYSIPITEQYYQQVEAVAEALSLPEQQFNFIKELIR
jgi:hypothetical protein